MQQINFQGKVSRLSDEASDHEFSKRIPEAQAVTTCCVPSIPMKNEASLKDSIKNLLQKNQKINRPLQWHLYCITLENIEFWIGSNDRFHKRLRYELVHNLWQNQRLQP